MLIKIYVSHGLLHPTLNIKNYEVIVTEQEELFKTVKENKYALVHYQPNQNMSKRKQRIWLYKELKALGANVEIIFTVKSYAEVKKEFLGNNTITYNNYVTLQIPRKNVDCDNFIVSPLDNYTRTELNRQMKLDLGVQHDSPYHAETIVEHILACEKNSIDSDLNEYEKNILYVVSAYHDLGKFITKKDIEPKTPAQEYFVKLNGRFSQYLNHEYVSAFYFLALNQGNYNEKDTELIAEIIFQHNIARNNDLSEKYIKKNKLDEETLNLINEFTKIDAKSKTIDVEIFETYTSLLK